ncbi:hypothetical protein PINS_up014462 [Pythium insidiosum]|nr:hypothetical protein PINS_up014462 [Pythium insidiosum]
MLHASRSPLPPPASTDSEPTQASPSTSSSPSPLPLSLDEQRLQFENKLLHVTRKLCRKYAKQLDDGGRGARGPSAAASPAKLRERAEKWSHSDELSDAERYRLCAAGRFTTQHAMDFYERPVEPRDAESDRHRRATQHAKYGDSLARNKHSLRAPF